MLGRGGWGAQTWRSMRGLQPQAGPAPLPLQAKHPAWQGYTGSPVSPPERFGWELCRVPRLRSMLQALRLKDGEYLPGNTKMFLKAGVLSELRMLREKTMTR